MKEYFVGIPKIVYEGPKSKNPLSFRYYSPDEVIAGKTMREHLRFSMAYWHTLCADGTDMFGRGTADKSFAERDPMAHARAKAFAAFELMDKLSIDYYCFHDRDIAPEGKTLAETNRNLDEISDLLKELQEKYNKKLLWGTANCFNHPRYMHGAGTSPHADVFAFAAAQIKKAIEITVKLGGQNYLFWGGREGYETLLNTDMGFELDNMARLLTMARDYGRKMGIKGDFYIEPKPKEPTKHQYDFDAATCVAFLQKYHLMDDFRLNIEGNHATLAGHTFQHELATARINGVFGSIDANTGDAQLGWDTDQFPTNVYDNMLVMLEVLRAGGFKTGGLNFDAKCRRGSFTPEDIVLAHIAGMDAYALALRLAIRVQEDGLLDDVIRERYASYGEGIGAEIVSGRATLESLEAYALAKGEVVDSVTSGRQEYIEAALNALMFE